MLTRRQVIASGAACLTPAVARAQSPAYAPVSRPDGWGVAHAADVGFDPAGLHDLSEMIDAGITVPNVHAVVIEQAGKLIFERYKPGEDVAIYEPLGRVEHGADTLHDIRSVTKSVTSLLLGLALDIQDPRILERPMSHFLPEVAQLGRGAAEASLHSVLTMTAGLSWNEAIVPATNPRSDFIAMMRAENPLAFILRKDRIDRSEETWLYNSGLTEIVGAIVERISGIPLQEFAQSRLFGPLGISNYTWFRPSAWPNDHFPSASAGLRMAARDVAKFGSLVLHGGRWRGAQIVPEDWMELSTRRHVNDIGASVTPSYGYGYFWYVGERLEGHKVIIAIGYGDQRIMVLPELGLSMTVLAGNYDRGTRNVATRLMSRLLRSRV